MTRGRERGGTPSESRFDWTRRYWLRRGSSVFKSPLAHQCDVARHTGRLEPLTRLLACFADASGLVVHGWVEDEFSDDLAGGGVDDTDVKTVDQHQDGGSGVGSADADVVQSAVVAEAEFAVGVEAPQVSCRIVLSPGGCADAKEDRARGA
jgi:hypothetical protein